MYLPSLVIKKAFNDGFYHQKKDTYQNIIFVNKRNASNQRQ